MNTLGSYIPYRQSTPLFPELIHKSRILDIIDKVQQEEESSYIQ